MSLTSVKALVRRADELFGKRSGLMSLWQEMAEMFYPERADFLSARNLGSDFAAHLMTSYPVMARRDLGNSLASMLRNSAKEWFSLGTNRPDKEDTEVKQWLEWVASLQRRAMYDRAAMLSRAARETDHDFATFGQGAISVELNRARNGLLYRNWHLRDVAWAENEEGKVTTFFRRWRPTAMTLDKLFHGRLSDKVVKALAKDPYTEFDCLHIIMPAEDYAAVDGVTGKPFRQPFVSINIDATNFHEMECTGSWTKQYTLPRWQTVSGTQYAHSPASVAGLPDARLIQDITRVLYEAGDKAVTPPLLGVQEAIRGDLAVYAGGVTWVDADYDERMGEVLRPMTQDKSGLAFGMELIQDIRGQLANAWYLNRLNLPPVDGNQMTAYEVSQRVQEFIRNALPLFEPMEYEYNASLCDDTLETLLRASPEMRNSTPRKLVGAEVIFTFQSPLREAIEKAKVGQLLEAQQIIASAVQLDAGVTDIFDTRKAAREALEATAPASWLRTEVEADRIASEREAQAQAAQLLAVMQQGANVAKTLGETRQATGGQV